MKDSQLIWVVFGAADGLMMRLLFSHASHFARWIAHDFMSKILHLYKLRSERA